MSKERYNLTEDKLLEMVDFMDTLNIERKVVHLFLNTEELTFLIESLNKLSIAYPRGEKIIEPNQCYCISTHSYHFFIYSEDRLHESEKEMYNKSLIKQL